MRFVRTASQSSEKRCSAAVKDRQTVKKNIAALLILQGANYLLPLITLPYLLRVLGQEKFGLVAISMAFIGYLIVVVDFGFNLSAPRQISLARGRGESVGKILGSVLIAKVALMFGSLAMLGGAVLLVPALRNESALFLVTSIAVVGNVMFPVWLYQGLEKMAYITVLGTTGKVAMLAALLVLVKEESDYVLAAGIQSSFGVLAGILSIPVLLKAKAVSWVMPSFEDVSEQFREAWPTFVSTASMSLYTNSSVLILGLAAAPIVVGGYSAVEKLVRATQAVMGPISQAVYPYVCRLAGAQQSSAYSAARSLVFVLGGLGLLISVSLFAFADEIAFFLFGYENPEAATLLQILSPVPMMVALSNVFGIQIMLAFGMHKAFGAIAFYVGILSVTAMIPLAFYSGATGIAFGVVLTEIVVTLIMMMVLCRRGMLAKLWKPMNEC